MNHIYGNILRDANIEAIYNLYLYLANKSNPQENETLKSIAEKMNAQKNNSDWSDKDTYRFEIFKNAVLSCPTLANSKIQNLTLSDDGLSACCFVKADNNVSFVFKGTGNGEWLDNGIGLSGIPEENTYTTYTKGGEVLYNKTIKRDYATDQQVEALNWFSKTVSENSWDSLTGITLSGHSKGGNKAQFITINSDLVNTCYSFSGHGFSPEAISHFKKQYPFKYDLRRKCIHSFSADNDYVNVLGESLVPQNHIYYFLSQEGLHNIDAIINNDGKLRPQCEQGPLSLYIQSVSQDLMRLNPQIRKYATLGIMNIFQKYIGKSDAIGGESVSIQQTLAGLGIATNAFLNQLNKFN